MPYPFTRLVAPGWSLFRADPAVGDEHLVRFPRAATRATRYQLPIFLGARSRVILSGTDHDFIVAPGQCSLDTPVDEYPAGCLWTETPIEPGAIRLCLAAAPVGFHLRRWTREMLELPAGGAAEASGDLLLLMSGPAEIDGVAAKPGDYTLDGRLVASESCRILRARLQPT